MKWIILVSELYPPKMLELYKAVWIQILSHGDKSLLKKTNKQMHGLYTQNSVNMCAEC